MKSSISQKLSLFFEKNRAIKTTAIAVVLCFVFVLTISLFSGHNIFDPGKSGQPNKLSRQQNQNWFITNITKIQQSFNKDMTAKIRDYKKGQGTALFFVLLFIAGAYGFLHGIGPGHGKTIIAGWVLSQQRTLGEISLVSAVSSFIHAFSAVMIVFFSYQALGKLVPGAVDKLGQWFQIAAGLLLIVIGLQVLVEYLLTKLGAPRSEEGATAAENNQGFTVSTNPWSIAFTIGIVPCPLTAIIFAYCLAGNMLWLGLAMAASFAIGSGLSIFAIATTTWLMKSGALNQKVMHIRPAILSCASVAGGLLFLAMGYLTLVPYII